MLTGVLVATAAAKTNATDGVGIKSETKDKRQVNQHTRVLGYQAGVSAQPTPSPTQTVYGHHSAGQYVTRPQQPAESEQQQQHQNDPEVSFMYMMTFSHLNTEPVNLFFKLWSEFA